ncbi:MAG: tRNA (uracil-5-)-methyltransferase [Campylobacterota bacterium]|nr:tRNA (uracil-5-)-methyltransferase [Campylobacterota bacterium]
MKCSFFGQCGSCVLYQYSYDEQFELKANEIRDSFEEFDIREFELFKTTDGYFRNRVEFKIWHEKDENISFAMRSLNDSKAYIQIDSCAIANIHINSMMQKIIPLIQGNKILRERLFGLDFLSSTDGEILISLLYHKAIDLEWEKEARKLKNILGCDIIGRSRGKKIVIDRDFVNEKIKIYNDEYVFCHIENSFTQPNGDINQKIISFLFDNTKDSDHDLLELYCGMGNLTIPLAKNFNRVLAIEVSKSSIASAKTNIKANNINNIEFARMSAEEFAQAMDKKRVFNRLSGIELDSYNFKSVLVDPPRSGLDSESLELVKRFEKILYISCNPNTLKENLRELLKTHEIKNAALFDQFAYTPHLEMGVILERC